MYTAAFLITAAGYLALTAFVLLSYPVSWRKTPWIAGALLLWHALGTAALVGVFTCCKRIPWEGVRIALSCAATVYYIPVTLLALLFFLRLVCRRAVLLVLEHTGRELPGAQRRWIWDARTHAALFLVLSFAVCAAGYRNADKLHIQRYEVMCSQPAAESELTLCLIADLHAGSGTWPESYERLAELIDQCRADALLIAGDVFDETTTQQDVEHVAKLLRSIQRPRCGVFFVCGNHDPRTDDWTAEQLRPLGVRVLKDELVLLGEDLQLIGTLDRSERDKSLELLFDELRPDPDKPMVLLTHRPERFRTMAELGCDLALAGHTHGFNIPQYMGAPLLSDMYSGQRQYGAMSAVTTSGTGAWGFHYKWPAHNEVVCIHMSFPSGEPKQGQ